MRELDFPSQVIPYIGVAYCHGPDGYIVWRMGTGDNVELLHLHANVQGGGRRLLLEMLKRLGSDPPYATVFGFTRSCNHAAREFYTAMGFTLSSVTGVYADGHAVVFSAEYEQLCRLHGIHFVDRSDR